MLKIAFLDTIGLKYDGNTLNNRGLGGSESAIIYLSKELVKLGFNVTVFNEVENEGIYDGVRYFYKYKEINEDFDVLISSRSCLPFVPDYLRDDALSGWNTDISKTSHLVKHSKYKVVWLHDTFCSGDNYLEHLCVDGYIDELFCLSDWHSNYIMNGHVWRGRYFEVLKKKVWQTRNGIQNYIDEVNILDKDPNLFVYNSSITKGMIPLLEKCWKKIKNRIPAAKLIIIGGYYRGANCGEPDENERQFYVLRENYSGTDDIQFTGIIKQQDIAQILSRASLMIYPSEFPETYGISTLEAINYNVPLVGCRFGALEEIAAEQTSYLIDYDINYNDYQVDRFVSMVEKAYYDNYLRQQKMYACNAFKPWIGWDTVALQWKQHLYNKLDIYMNINELRKVRRINSQVIKLFGRRFQNPEDFIESKTNENRIVVVSPFYNAEKYLENCIRSVAGQDYNNYIHYLIDDLSDDNSYNTALNIINSLPDNTKDKFVVIKNKDKKYALGNQVETIEQYARDDDIILLLDGDDWLINNPDVFNIINNEYNDGAEFTYGSCHSLADNIDLIAQPYPEAVHKEKSYRGYLFNWGMPYTHLRTFKGKLFKKVSRDNFIFKNDEFYRAGGDNAIFYPLIENCSDYHNIRVIQQVLYIYNDLNPLNDYKVNQVEQNTNAEEIRSKMCDIKRINEIKDEIVESVRNHDPEAIELYKTIATERENVWIDRIDGKYLVPRVEWLIKKIHSASKGNKDVKILDIGSWTGSIANHIYGYGYNDITCMDISKRVVEVGWHTYPHLKWIQGDIEDLNIDGEYDIVLMCEVLEHLVNPDKVIEFVVNNLLTKDGSLIYTIPDEETVFGEKMLNNSSEHISRINKTYLQSISNDLETMHAYNDGQLTYDWYVGSIKKKFNILIALPTAKYIESDTFKSIYRLDKPENCELYVECFYGYRIDQVRNLICNFAIENNFDYVFFVDSDIILPQNALTKLLSLNADVAAGVYIQRKPGQIIPEIYERIGSSVVNMNYQSLVGNKIFPIAGCGFGCTLVNIETIKKIGYPQFEYHPAIRIEDTISEDLDFCWKAERLGSKMLVDTSVKCEHIGEQIYRL